MTDSGRKAAARLAAGGRGTRLALLGLAGLLVAAVVAFVDLAPRVESDFFFATDDPELATARAIDELFPAGGQLVLRAAPPPHGEGAARAGGVGGGEGAGEGEGEGVRSEGYVEEVRELTDRLAEAPGVRSVQSLTRGPATPEAAFDGPFWRRLLVAEDEQATTLVVRLGPGEDPAAGVDIDSTAGADPAAGEAPAPVPAAETIATVEAAVAASELEVAISGVPYVVELVRRYLLRDLRLFSGAALVVFALLVGFLFRSARVVAGTLGACLAACALTLALLAAAGTGLGILTANLVTIVFVLTLSHTVFLTANRRRLGSTRAAVRETLPASFWCMATTLLGFLSLLLASARPMRELGVAGAIGTAVAIVVAYLVYSPFLATGESAGGASEPAPAGGSPGPLAGALAGRERGVAVAVVAVCLLAGTGISFLSTDPSLLSYFRAGGEIHRGLAAIDADGGSSPLSLVVRDPGGGRFDDPQVFARLEAAQAALEADPATGVVLSAAPLVAEARRTSPLAAMAPIPTLLDVLEQPQYDRVALSFLTPERERASVFVRLREEGRTERRERVVERLRAAVAGAGLEPELVGGLYELQGKLSSLVGRSLAIGLGGLLALFALIAAGVTRDPRSAAAMVGCLVLVPLFLLGAMGWLGLTLDIISSPAANIALALGVDSMIHLASAARRARRDGLPRAAAWGRARADLARPVAGAALVVAAGFGLFALSSFPPTQRFGAAVVLGTLAAAAVALGVLPTAAAGRAAPEPGSEPASEGRVAA